MLGHREVLTCAQHTGSREPGACVEQDVESSWSDLARAQDGLVTWQQALAHGYTPDAVVAQIEGGRWTRRGRGVLATFTGPLLPEARLRAALLSSRGPRR